MLLWINSDSSYLSVSKSRSRVSGYYFRGNTLNPNIPLGNQSIFHNTPIHVKASILRHITSATSESKITAAFTNANLAIPENICLLETGHPQLVTPFEIDNSVAHGISTK